MNDAIERADKAEREAPRRNQIAEQEGRKMMGLPRLPEPRFFTALDVPVEGIVERYTNKRDAMKAAKSIENGYGHVHRQENENGHGFVYFVCNDYRCVGY